MKKGIFIAVGVSLVVLTGIILYNKFKKPVEDTPQGFNELIERAEKVHPELYAWWERLSINSQINIENSMTPEIMAFLSKELTKKSLTEETKLLLKKVGYVA